MSALLGATPLGDGRTEFLLWAPGADRVDLRLLDGPERVVAMGPLEKGYRHAVADDVPPGTRYLFRLDGRELPDPASRLQPEGVQGPSAVLGTAFPWEDRDWAGIPLSAYVVYELHVGTFTPEGTFDAVIPRLGELVDLGVTAVEVMPVAQFPGTRNWGYDGVFPYAVQWSYGGPEGLARLVDECHRHGLAFILDVVYNHLGPEGGVLEHFGPYFSGRHRTPWGAAINFDGPGSEEVRRYFVENALRWSSEFHVDALRLDAIHGIVDGSAHPFLQQLAEAADAHPRPLLLFAETDQNDARIVTSRGAGGFGVHAQWSDDFHHALHAVLTGERHGYYRDFGSLEQLAKAHREGFVYSGQFSAFRGRPFGASSAEIPAERLVVFGQNHDQVGNRVRGERLSASLSLEQLKLAAGVVLLAPFVPLVFMGEEYGELAPFRYFTSHTDPVVAARVRQGRREEFAAFGWGEDAPDPQDVATFEHSKLDHGLKEKEPHRSLLAFYGELLGIRREVPALRTLSKNHLEVASDEAARTLTVRRWTGEDEAFAVFDFGDRAAEGPALPTGGGWTTLLESADERWGGPGAERPAKVPHSVTVGPHSFVLLHRSRP